MARNFFGLNNVRLYATSIHLKGGSHRAYEAVWTVKTAMTNLADMVYRRHDDSGNAGLGPLPQQPFKKRWWAGEQRTGG